MVLKIKGTQEMLKREIQKILNKDLPDSYGRKIFAEKTETVSRYFYEMAEMGRRFAA